MSDSNVFPAKSVISGYISAERMLEDVLRVVPFCPEHENVWSPMLVTVLLETCSQLDSLWAYEAKQSPYVTKARLDIRDYFQYFGEHVSYKWVVFWAEEPVIIRPFGAWTHQQPSERGVFSPLEWWNTYNHVKHDRLGNRHEATLSKAVHALAGLYLAILRCEYCRDEIAHANWVRLPEIAGGNPVALLGEDSSSSQFFFVAAETSLFSYPVGWCKEKIEKGTNWAGIASYRFRRWFEEFSN